MFVVVMKWTTDADSYNHGLGFALFTYCDQFSILGYYYFLMKLI
jgi:hypothetical protein